MIKRNYLPIGLLFILILFFFKGVILEGKLPIPSDTIIGLYHPYRDLYSKNYPNGIPFKNFLITDPVRQQYPWRNLSISIEKMLQIPTWSPYSAAGAPLLANFQTGAFYPLNLLFLILPFSKAWTLLVFLQPLLGGIFMYLFLQKLRVHKLASFLGSFVFSFSAFNVVWLEWNTIDHVVIWLPLILLAKEHLLAKRNFKWVAIFIVAECSAILAGHLQALFYTMIISNTYLFARIFQMSKEGKAKNILLFMFKKYRLFFALGAIVALITAVQWLPAIQFINLSARGVDQLDNWKAGGWFIPWEHLLQFITPDFFGNPTTLNYWGTWNYAELVGYVGIIPLIMALYAIFFRRDKKTLYFGFIFFISLIFALPTFFAKLPFTINIPFLSTSQPTRLLLITDFSLAVLSAFGLDYFTREDKKIKYVFIGMLIVFIGIWGFTLYGNKSTNLISAENLSVVKRNIIFPTILFVISAILILIYQYANIKNVKKALIVGILIVSVFDLFRFADKFTPFTPEQYLFPNTKTIDFLQKNIGNYRIMTTDSRILPPNFSSMYKLQSIDMYDPLYLLRYGELIAASERGKPDITPPFGFNRIITPHRFDSKIIDLLGVKYILSLSDLDYPKLTKVFQEGETRVYENKNVLPRVFFVEKLERFIHTDKQNAINIMFKEKVNLSKEAIVEYQLPNYLAVKWDLKDDNQTVGAAKIINYSENKIAIETNNSGNGFLVLTDTYYPTWHATIDQVKTQVYTTDYNFKGIFVPAGKHMIEYSVRLL